MDFPSEIVACIGGIALKRSGHDFSFTNRSSGRCCDFAPPWNQRTGGTTISSVPICPVITENGNTVTVKIQAFLGYTPSRFSHGFGGSFLSTKAGPTPATCVPAVFKDILSLLSNHVKNRVRKISHSKQAVFMHFRKEHVLLPHLREDHRPLAA